MDEHTISAEQISAPVNASCTGAQAVVMHGDAFDLFDKLQTDQIDLVITSPPYWGHRDYGLPHNWDFFNDIPPVAA
jgi:tRNA1(Val) A37 N6-methylase TrmN6